MDVLRDVYSGDDYDAHLNTSPALAVAVVGGEAIKFEQILLHPRPTGLSVCVTSLPSVEAIVPKKAKSAIRTDYFLKSHWCVKHQRKSFSCIVLPLSWDTWEGKREQESNVLPLLEKAKSRVRSLKCKVVIACTTTKPTSPSRLASFQEATHTLKIFLGTHFAAAVLLGEGSDTVRSSSELLSAVVSAAVDYHSHEIERLKNKKKDLTVSNRERGEEIVNAAVVRCYFQIGWHELVLEKKADAVQSFFKACRACRAMYPRFPPFEARLAVTVFLRHIVSVLPKCGELFTFGSPAHTQVTQMVDWMKAAYSTVDVSQQGKRLLMALQYFLEAEWCERMATRTENLDAYIHDDLLFSAACSLNETLPFLSAEKDKLDIPAPQILGAEYRSDTYAAVVLSGISREAIQVKIRSHLDGGRVSKKHTAGFDRPLFKAFLLDAGHSHPSVATALFKSQVGALLREWPNVVTILNGLLYRRALTVLDDTELLEEVPAEEICKLLVSGCVDPARPAMHAIFADVLQKLTLRTPLLEYPHSCFLPPVSVNFVFEKRECVAVSGCVAMVVSFFTTSTADIVVHNIKAEVVRLTTNEEKNSAISDTVVACAENDTLIVRESLQPDTQCTTRIGVCFPRPGKYRCTRLLCDAVVGNVTVPISFNVDSGTRKRDCRCAEGEIIHVCMPTSLLTVDGPTTVEAVEGETVSVAFTISSTEGRLVNGKLLVPNTECFFEMESGQAHAEEKAGMGSDEQLRVHTLPNVDGGETTSFLLSGQCARSGYFAIPLLFQYESRDGVIVEVTRTLRVAVDPPFDVFFSCANSVRWCGDDTPESMLFHPTTSAAHVRKDVHVLEDAVDVTAGARGLGAKFFYCIRTDVDGLSCSTPIPLEEHSTMTVVATVVCRSKNGLGVSKADFVCSNHVELQYVSYGLLPCQLEMGESVTIAAQIRATRKMENFLPGFVRVLFSPGGDNTARLFTDLGLPAMTVVSTPVTVTTAYPPFVECGQPFIFRLSVQNTAMAPFQGELTLDTRAKEFSIGGRAQWFFSLGPREEKSTELLLTPLVHGVCSLPRFQIRSVTNGFVVSTNRETRAVTVL